MVTIINAHRICFAFAFIALLTVATTAAAQQDVELSAELHPPVVSPGQFVDYSVFVSVEGNYDIELLEPPDFGPLQVISTRSEPSFLIRNSQATRSLRLIYRLVAPTQNDQGKEFKIGPPRFAVGHQTLTPDPVTLRVSKDAPSRPQSPDSNSPDPRAQARAFIEIVLSPERDPYPGEQLHLQYELWIRQSRQGLQGSGFSDPPLNDFWVEELTDMPRQRRRNIRRYGSLWEAIPLRSLALFPLRPGPATIDSIELPLVQRAFFGQQAEVNPHSEPVEINVQPLPPGAPADFSEGNIGKWQLSADLDSQSARVGGQIVLTTHISGIGLPGQLGWPTLEENDDFRLLATEDKTSKRQSPMGIEGTRTFQFRLMPLKEGALTTPRLTFSYFDPDQAEYFTLNAPQFPLQIEPGELPKEPDPEEEVAFAPLTTLELHEPFAPGELSSLPERLAPPLWLLFLPILGLLLLLLEALLGPSIRARQAPVRLRRRILKQANQSLDEAGTPPDPEILLKTLSFILTNALDIQIGALSTQELARALKPIALPEELKNQLLALVDELTKSRYSPAARSDSETLAKTRSLIEALIHWRFSDEGPARPSALANASILFGSAFLIFAAANPVASAQISSTSTEALVQQAQTAADEENWELAARTWRQLAQTQDDPTYDFNAGTAFARAGQIGFARQHLERAVAAGADTREVRDNLDQVIREVRRRSPAHATFTPQKLNALGLQYLAPWLVVLSLWFALTIALFRRFALPLFAKRALFYPLFALSILVALSSAALSYYLQDFANDTSIGVVLNDGVPLRDAPSHHAATQKNGTGLSSGAVFRLRQRRDGWSQVELPSGLTGWLPDEALGLIQESEL